MIGKESDLIQYMIATFPSVYCNPHARELLENVVCEARNIMGTDVEQSFWLEKMLPEITSQEIRNIWWR